MNFDLLCRVLFAGCCWFITIRNKTQSLGFFCDCSIFQHQGINFLRTVGNHSPKHAASYPRRHKSIPNIRMTITLSHPQPYGCFDKATVCVISGFRREVDDNCALLGHYAARRGNSFPTFQNILSSRAKNSWSLKMGPIVCPKRR